MLLYQRRIESPSSEFLGGLAEVNDSDNTASREWETLTLPILNLVKDNELNTRYSTSDISDKLEEDLQKVGIQLLTLAESEYINIQHDVRTFGNPYGYMGFRLQERGRRVLGVWPSQDLALDFLNLLEHQSSISNDPEEQSRLRNAISSLKGRSMTALANVISGTIQGKCDVSRFLNVDIDPTCRRLLM